MFWKDQLAKEILARSSIDKYWLDGLTEQFPSIRVKTVDANGRVPVIQLNGKGEWLKPKEWALIHVANLKQQHVELHQRLITVGSDPTIDDHADGGLESAESEAQSDPTEFQKLQNSFDELYKSYVRALDELWSVSQGNEVSVAIKDAVARMVDSGNIYFI